MNCCSLTRRSHAAVWAVTPAQGSGEDSRKDTFTVDPILKSSILPTVRHIWGVFRRPSRNAKLGTATRAAPMELKAILRRTRNFRRLFSVQFRQPISDGTLDRKIGRAAGWESR